MFQNKLHVLFFKLDNFHQIIFVAILPGGAADKAGVFRGDRILGKLNLLY